MLEWGIARPLLIRREAVDMGLDLRLLFASDLHMRASQAAAIATELSLAVEKCRPHALLLGGDLVDSAEVLPLLARLLSELGSRTRVGAVSGNHDALAGKKRVRSCVLEAGACWLEDTPMQLDGLTVLGSLPAAAPRQPWLFCGHYPTSFPAARKAGARLVLAGHLHGWQIVLGQVGDYLFPGALLSRWNGLRFDRGGSTLLVSRGMTDLFPLRWNCPREVLDIRL